MKKYIYIVLALSLVLSLNGVQAANTSTPVAGISVSADSLVKGSLSTIYYYAADGNRYVFPNDKTFGSWFGDFGNVKIITDTELAKIPLKGNITYRPGVRMVKIQTVSKVYAVDEGGQLRWIESEEIAKKLYGNDWNKKIDDISDAFFVNYKEGPSIKKVEDYNPTTVTKEVKTINKEKGITEGVSTPQATTTVGSSTSVVAKSGYSATPNSAEEAAPNISDVKLGTITSSTAQISWYTNKFSDSRIKYSLWPLSTAASSSISTIKKDESVKNHQVNLKNLKPLSTYYFKAVSTDKQSRMGESPEYIFKTTLNGTTTATSTTPGGTTPVTPGTPGTPVTPSAPDTPSTPASATKVTICHVPTDDPTNKQTISIDESALSAHLAHGDTIGACPGADTVAPVISGIAVSGLTANSAVISWKTDESASSTVSYGLTSLYGSVVTSTQMASGTLYAHTVSLSGLISGTLYHYKVRAVDSSGNASESADATFTTGGTTCADLTVTDIEFTPSSPTVGQSVARVSKVKNLGTIASPVVNIKGYVDDVMVAYGSFGPLQPGATIADYSHNVQWGGNWTAIVGTHKFEWKIDADNHVTECDETNNVLIEYVTVASGGTRIVTTENAFTPGIDGDILAWQEDDEIYFYNVSTGVKQKLISTAGTNMLAGPSVSGNRILYYFRGNNNTVIGVAVYDITTNVEQVIATSTLQGSGFTNHDIDGDNVVYGGAGEGTIEYYNLATGQRKQLAGERSYYPAVSGDDVVWEYIGGGGGDDYQIYHYKISTGITRSITARNRVYPGVSNGTVVYNAYYGSGGLWNIYSYDLNTNIETQRTAKGSGSGVSYNFPVSGNKFVWLEGYVSPSIVYVYDISTGVKTIVTETSSYKTSPNISGNRVTWADSNSTTVQRRDVMYIDLTGN